MNTTPTPWRSAFWLALALISGVSMLIAGCGSVTHPSFASSYTPTPVPATLTPFPSTPTLDPSDPLRYEKQEIVQMRERLQNPNLDPRSRETLEWKLKSMEGDVRSVETARARPPDWGIPVDSLTPVPTTQPRPTGILEHFSRPPTYPNDTTFTSGWQEKINGEWVQVFAGVPASDPTQGFVYVRGDQRGREYPTPTQVGAVTITSYEGTVLTLTSADGTTFLFDAATGTFVGE